MTSPPGSLNQADAHTQGGAARAREGSQSSSSRKERMIRLIRIARARPSALPLSNPLQYSIFFSHYAQVKLSFLRLVPKRSRIRCLDSEIFRVLQLQLLLIYYFGENDS